jgi:hypothetical protein
MPCIIFLFGATIGPQILWQQSVPIPRTSPRLLFLDTAESCPKPDDLEKTRELTIAKYRENGVEVIHRSERDLMDWLKYEGKRFGKAQLSFQYIAYARSMQADVIGGVLYYEITFPVPKGDEDRWVPQFNGWCYNLRTCQHTNIIEFKDGTTVGPRVLRASRFHFQNRDEWKIETKIPTGVSSVSGPGRWTGYRAVLGVEFVLSQNQVKRVLPDSPASRIGIMPDDHIASINGKETKEAKDCFEAMRNVKDGDQLNVKWTREKQVMIATTQPIDGNAFLNERQAAFFDKEIPDLEAVTYDGKRIHLHQFKGKVVILSFDDESCCAEMMAQEFRDEPLVFINISRNEDDNAWRKYVTENCLSGIQIRAPQWADTLFVTRASEIYLVDKNGILASATSTDWAARAVMSLVRHGRPEGGIDRHDDERIRRLFSDP